MEHQPTKAEVTSALTGVGVLIVEDDFFIGLDLEMMLSEAGAKVAGPCRTVKDALESVDNNSVAAAILDIRLGDETVGAVARQLNERGIPFMFYTGQVDTDPVCKEWPRHKIVSKPADSRTLLAAVAGLLK